MSFWIYQKEKNGKTGIYSVTVPIEGLIIILGVAAGMLVPRYMDNGTKIVLDSVYLSFTGFVFLLIAKISLFRKGIWNSWGSKHMSRPLKYVYRCGYILIAIGIFVQTVYLHHNYFK